MTNEREKTMGDEADADWQAGLGEWGYEEARRAMADERIKTDKQLPKFLLLVRTMRWRQGVPKVWNEQFRFALGDGLVKIGWGGLIELTDDGAALATRS
jgi:hypothetical protein